MATLKKKAPEKKVQGKKEAPKSAPKTEERKAPGTAVQTQGKQTMASVPEHMRADAGKGMGNLDSTDYEMPRLKLIQGISEELQVYDGLKAGDFFHSLAEESLGNELPVVPLYLSKRYILWRPRPPLDMGGILARADDAVHWQPSSGEFKVKIDKKGTIATWKLAPTVAQSRLADWGTYDPSDSQSQPAATLCYVIVMALPTFPELSPVAIFLQRASVKPARKLQGKINITGAPAFGMQFVMSSFVDNSPAGDFNNYRFTSDGFVDTSTAEGKATYERYKQMSAHFEKMGVRVKDLEAAQGDIDGGESGAAPDTKGKF